MCVGGLGKACKLPWIRKAAKRRIALNRRGALMPEVMFVGNRIRGRSLLRNLFTIRSGERLAARFRLAARPFAVLYDTAGNLVTAVTGEKQHGKKGMRFRYVSQLYDGAGRQVAQADHGSSETALVRSKKVLARVSRDAVFMENLLAHRAENRAKQDSPPWNAQSNNRSDRLSTLQVDCTVANSP